MPETKEELKPDTRPVVSGLLDVFSEPKPCSGNGGGIGDLLLLSSILPGLQAKYPNMTLRVIAQRKDWLRLSYSGLVVSFDEYNQIGVRGEKSFYHFSRWWCQHDLEGKDLGLNRHHYFGKRFGVTPTLPKITVRSDALAWARNEFAEPLKNNSKLVGLFPYSTSKQREWPDRHWVETLFELKRSGHTPVVVCGPGDDKRSEHYTCMRYWGLGPEQTAAMLSLFSLSIGNDSGMAHVSAAIGRPTLVIGAPTDIDHVFSFYGVAKAIQAPGECTTCFWVSERGYRHSCTYGCELLNDLKPKTVIEEIRKRLG